MMRKTSLFVALLLMASALMTGCFEPKYCAEPGCPNETQKRSREYCISHECYNMNCHNKKYIGDYCKECIDRAIND